MMNQNKMTLAAAATLAEVQTKGTAIRAMAHMHGDDMVIEVHCMVEEKIVAVDVDCKTAKIAKTKEVKNLEEGVS
jgi:hypothetical protein